MMNITKEDLKVLQMLYGLRQTGLALLLDCSETYITKILQGEKRITRNIERKVIERFKLDAEMLTMIKLIAMRMRDLQAEGKLDTDKLNKL